MILYWRRGTTETGRDKIERGRLFIISKDIVSGTDLPVRCVSGRLFPSFFFGKKEGEDNSSFSDLCPGILY